jgi:hypothetical protein
MRPERRFQDDGQHNQQAEEEHDRDELTHSFSPLLSTAKCARRVFGSSKRDIVPVLFACQASQQALIS